MGGVKGDIFSWRDIDRASRSGVNKGSTSTRASKFENKGVRPRKVICSTVRAKREKIF
jgi:hypothetical protein